MAASKGSEEPAVSRRSGSSKIKTSKMTRFDIAIVSDTICPFCYIGKAKLDEAIVAYKALHPGSSDSFSTTWYPFYLNPSAPKKSVDKSQAYAAKYGAAERDQIFKNLSRIGGDLGIRFRFGGKMGNTRDSHRLIQLAKTKGADVQTKVVEELFKAYFELEKDISSHDVLRDAGVKAGLSRDEVVDWLVTDKGGDSVDREVEDARGDIITGVPNFTIQGRYEIRGAQDPGAFLRVFEKIKAMESD